MHTDIVKPTVYGLMAEFETPEDLTEAARKTIDGGYTKLDAYTPFPVEELSELVASVRQKFHVLPLLVLGAGITGVTVAYLMQYYMAAVDVPIFQFWRIIINGYPMNLGSRALNSWPAFTVVMFEMTVLFSAGAAVFGMLGLNYLPMPYHPVFNVERFSRASSDKFFLCIEAIDPNFDLRRTKQFLEGLKPVGIVEEVATSEIPDKEIEWPEL
jgi:hypothetical protein